MSALWRRTKRVRAGIAASWFMASAVLPPDIVSVPEPGVLSHPTPVVSCHRPRRTPRGTRPTPRGVRERETSPPRERMACGSPGAYAAIMRTAQSWRELSSRALFFTSIVFMSRAVRAPLPPANVTADAVTGRARGAGASAHDGTQPLAVLLTATMLAGRRRGDHPTTPAPHFMGRRTISRILRTQRDPAVVAGQWRSPAQPLSRVAVLGIPLRRSPSTASWDTSTARRCSLPAVAAGLSHRLPLRRVRWLGAATTAVLDDGHRREQSVRVDQRRVHLIPADIAIALFAGIADRKPPRVRPRAPRLRRARRPPSGRRGAPADRRELHDVVAHTMATINVQASAAAALAARPPETRRPSHSPPSGRRARTVCASCAPYSTSCVTSTRAPTPPAGTGTGQADALAAGCGRPACRWP